MDATARGTGPLPHVQGLGPVLDTALRADWAGRLEPADLHQGPPVPDRLVFQHVHELRPARVVHGFGQPGPAKPSTARSSTPIAWFSRISFVESWWWNSRRASATCACARATFRRAFSRFFDPFRLRDSSRWARLSFFSARRRNLGESIFVPSER